MNRLATFDRTKKHPILATGSEAHRHPGQMIVHLAWVQRCESEVAFYEMKEIHEIIEKVRDPLDGGKKKAADFDSDGGFS
ncbi:MAG: hypothetical protein N2039_00850 [Gemmataceae bacterium]|nr:hypothetical protein [Gemmataceae bacterium]